MDCLNDSLNLMIVSDLDNTMVDHDDPENLDMLRFNSLWETYYRQNSLLVFSTGRSPTIYKQLRTMKPLLTPDITVMSVGTEITYGESMEPDIAWKQLLSENWNRDIVCEETAKFPDLVLQSETEQRPHKVSFYVEKSKATRIMEILLKRLEERGLDVKIIYSNGIALDVLPKAAGKGNALEYLLRTYEASGKSPKNVLVCGDSGNDTDLFTLPKIYGVMVSNAYEELLQWHAKNAKNNPNIFHSSERCAAAIIQAFDKFGLGPHISARDMDDFSLREVDNVSHEVVNFYLFYERWRRAEVHRSEQSLARFKSVFSPLGIFVNYFGTEQSLEQYLVEVQGYYGDKKGTQFRVWLDRISSAQIGVDTWVVKFYQWEQTGEEQQGYLTKVLLEMKTGAPTWMHMHQNLTDGSGEEWQKL